VFSTFVVVQQLYILNICSIYYEKKILANTTIVGFHKLVDTQNIIVNTTRTLANTTIIFFSV